MKKLLTGAMSLAIVASMIVPAVSQAKGDHHLNNPEAADVHGDANAIGKFNSENHNKHRHVVSGTVTAISATSITVQVGFGKGDENSNSNSNSNSSVTPKSFTFIIDSTTKIIRKHKATAGVNEIAVGDKVQVWATSLTNGTAKLIWDKSIWWVGLHGTISNLNTTAMTFTLTLKFHGINVTTNVKMDSSTTIWMDSTPKTVADLANGQTIDLRGSWDSVNSWVLAKRINIKS